MSTSGGRASPTRRVHRRERHDFKFSATKTIRLAPWPADDPAAHAGYADHPPGWASSPTPRCASAARPARWRARSGTTCRGRDQLPGCLRQHERAGCLHWRHVAFIEQIERPGTGPGPEIPVGAHGVGAGGFSARLPLAHGQRRVQALHGVRLPGCVPDGRADAHEFGTVVVSRTLQRLRVLRVGCPFGVIERREGDGRAGSARCATTGSGDGLEPACAKACPTSRSSSARWTSCASGPGSRVGDLHAAARTRRGCTWTTRRTGSAVAERSSCSWTSPRCTACRRTRWSHPGPARHVETRRHRRGRARRHRRSHSAWARRGS